MYYGHRSFRILMRWMNRISVAVLSIPVRLWMLIWKKSVCVGLKTSNKNASLETQVFLALQGIIQARLQTRIILQRKEYQCAKLWQCWIMYPTPPTLHLFELSNITLAPISICTDLRASWSFRMAGYVYYLVGLGWDWLVILSHWLILILKVCV